jgi:multidrug efflux system outer membrane protein
VPTDLACAARALALCAALAIAGCATQPPSPPPVQDVPAGDAANVVAQQWWNSFDDAELAALVDEALASNLDLKLAIARVDEARGLAALARSELFPSLDLNVGAGRSKISGVGSTPLPPGTPLISNSYSVGFSAAYEVDLWGRVRSGVAAAQQDLLASRFAHDTVRIAVASETARNYFSLRAVDAQLVLLRETLATRDETVRLQTDRYQAGVIGELDLRQSRAERASVAADIAAAERAARTLESALAVLAGRSPRGVFATDVARRASTPREIDPVPDVPAGLPSDLLAQRPDIRAAENRLAAADYRISEARAQYFPTIALTGSFGGASAALGDLLISPARVWSIAAALAQPIFRAGQISAQVDVATARREQALIAYMQSVQTAFREAHDAFAAQRNSRDVFDAQTERSDNLAKALELARLRYEAGYSPFLEVLDAQRNLLAAERARIDAARDVRIATVDVYRALGGGWRTEAPLARN